MNERAVPWEPARAVRPMRWRYAFDVVGKSKFMTKEMFWKSIPRATPNSPSWRFRFLDAGAAFVGSNVAAGSCGFEDPCVGVSSSSSEAACVNLFASSVARIIS